ncbi:MAG TPA: metallophosphoesterase [Syntrophales bacterium]|nr:metallophosphoesterase [Syntrophales bacterium]
MRMQRRCRFIYLLASLFLVVEFAIPAVSHSSTLYEKSLKKLEENLKTASPDDFMFIVMGDSRDNDEVFKKILSTAAKLRPLFILHGGDAVFTGREKKFDHFIDIAEGALPETPLFVTIGNHDLTNNVKSVHGKQIFQEKIGPLNYALDLKKLGVKIVALDNSLYELTPIQLQYLEEQLTTKRKYKFVIMHVPPETDRWQDSHCFTKGADRLKQILAEKKVSVAFFSHLHLYAQDEVKGVTYIITGGAAAPLQTRVSFGEHYYHFIVVRVKDGKVSTEVIRTDSDLDKNLTPME